MKEEYIQVVDPHTGEVLAEHLKYKGRRMTHDGQEIPDPRPMAPPVGYKKQPSMADYVRDAIRSHKLAEEAQELGYETFEDANDFDVGDDFEPDSPYESELLDGHVERAIREGRIVHTPHGPAIVDEKPSTEASPKAPSKAPKKPKSKAPEPSDDDPEED